VKFRHHDETVNIYITSTNIPRAIRVQVIEARCKEKERERGDIVN